MSKLNKQEKLLVGVITAVLLVAALFIQQIEAWYLLNGSGAAVFGLGFIIYLTVKIQKLSRQIEELSGRLNDYKSDNKAENSNSDVSSDT